MTRRIVRRVRMCVCTCTCILPERCNDDILDGEAAEIALLAYLANTVQQQQLHLYARPAQYRHTEAMHACMHACMHVHSSKHPDHYQQNNLNVQAHHGNLFCQKKESQEATRAVQMFCLTTVFVLSTLTYTQEINSRTSTHSSWLVTERKTGTNHVVRFCRMLTTFKTEKKHMQRESSCTTQICLHKHRNVTSDIVT